MLRWAAAAALLALACNDEQRPDLLVVRYATPVVASGGVRQETPFGVIPASLDLNAAHVGLGAKLFVDRRLSGDGKVSCTSCHSFEHGGSNGRAKTDVPDRKPMALNVPTVFNVAFNFRFAWSGKFDDIGVQLDVAQAAPLAMNSSWEKAAKAIRGDQALEGAFKAAYADGLTGGTIRDALVQYCLSLVTPGAEFDKFLDGRAPLPLEADRGYHLFMDYGCVSCHQGQNVGGNLYERFGVADDDYLTERGNVKESDYGLYAATKREQDRFVFRVPSLRNVALTGPYFHDGSAATLEDAVEVMARVQIGRTLSHVEVSAIVAFLRTLTGEIPGGNG